MAFRATFCDPLEKDILELGLMSQGQILDTFHNIDWNKHLDSMNNTSSDKVHYSPSFEIENTDNKNGLVISAVGVADDYEFYVFYKRPKTFKLFGLFPKVNDHYLTEIQGQTKADVLQYITAFMHHDFDLLDQKIR